MTNRIKATVLLLLSASLLCSCNGNKESEKVIQAKEQRFLKRILAHQIQK